MKTAFELNTNDAIAFSRYIKIHHPLIKKFFFGLKYGPLFFGGIFLAVAFGLYINDPLTSVQGFAYIAILSFVAGLLNRFIINYWNTSEEKTYQNSPYKSLGEHTITTSPDGLSDDFGSKSRSVLWNDVDYIGMDDFGVYVTLKRTGDAKLFGVFGRALWADPQENSPYIIPRRAFSNDSDFTNFFETAKSWRQTYNKNG